MHKLKKYLALFYIFLCTGFTLGTLTLALVVESLVAYSRKTGWMSQHENTMVIGIIIIFIIYSLLIASWIANSYFQYKRIGKMLVIFILTASTVYSLWYWFTPKKTAPDDNYITSQDGRFVAGPYPDEEKMQYLKSHHFTAIISLLSPYVVPFEPILLDKEIKLAKQYNIPVMNFPMLPWITKNAESIDKIKSLASERNNHKYYVHCYYGRDRVSMFMRVVDQVSPVNVLNNNQTENKPLVNKIISHAFENGTGYLVNRKVIFGPVPSEDEFAKYVVNIDKKFTDNPIQTVISIQQTPENLSLHAESLKGYGIDFSIFIADEYPYDPDKFLALAKKIKAMSGGALVYANYTIPNVIPASLLGTLYSYLTDLPSVPYSSLQHYPNIKIHAEQIAPNILMGSKPEGFHDLYNLGIRSIAYIGDCKSNQSKEEEKMVKKAKITFFCFADDDAELQKTLSQNGPWYIYGPKLDQVQNKLRSHFLNAMPNLQRKS